MSDLSAETSLQSSYGRTFPESLATKITASVASLLLLPEKTCRSSQQGNGGRTLVLCLDPKEQSRGGFRTPNFSSWPNGAVVSSLSQVLERGSIPQQYFLSSTACAGILRRAEKRGKALPTPLLHALQAAVGASSEPETLADKTRSSPVDDRDLTHGQHLRMLVADMQRIRREQETPDRDLMELLG